MNLKVARSREVKNGIEWSTVNLFISNIQFPCMFRMSRECFGQLCNEIIAWVGESEFKSEFCINDFF